MIKQSIKDIIGIGVDLIEIKRFKEVLKKHDEAFVKRIFTPKEIKYCQSRADPAIHLAARFCVKEAVSKALGTGIGKDLRFLDIQTNSLENGKPQLELLQEANKHFLHPTFDLSISHTDSVATAFVIAYATTPFYGENG